MVDIGLIALALACGALALACSALMLMVRNYRSLRETRRQVDRMLKVAR
jgi:hypothetical protein